jgi:hypothetical protein
LPFGAVSVLTAARCCPTRTVDNLSTATTNDMSTNFVRCPGGFNYQQAFAVATTTTTDTDSSSATVPRNPGRRIARRAAHKPPLPETTSEPPPLQLRQGYRQAPQPHQPHQPQHQQHQQQNPVEQANRRRIQSVEHKQHDVHLVPDSSDDQSDDQFLKADGQTSEHSTLSDGTTWSGGADAVGNVDSQQAFDEQVQNGDTARIIAAVTAHPRSTKIARDAVMSILFVLETSPDKCEQFVNIRGLECILQTLSRHGRTDPVCAEYFCNCIFTLSDSRSDSVERELRSSGSCLAVLDCLGWHASVHAVVLAAIAAMSCLATMSPELCSILVQSKASAFVRRALTRSVTTFDRDANLAVIALSTVATIAEAHPDSLVKDGTLSSVLACCNEFRDEIVDEQVIRFLSLIVQSPLGKEILSADGEDGKLFPMELIAQLMQRCQFSPTTLRHACGVLLELVSSASPRLAAAFGNSDIVDSVLLALRLSGDASPRDQAVGLAADTLDLSRRMTRLGADMCGALLMAGCITDAVEAVSAHRTSRDVAMRVAMLIEALARSRLGASIPFELAHACLAELLDMWSNDLLVVDPVQRAFTAMQRRDVSLSADGFSQGTTSVSQDDINYGPSSGTSSGSQGSSPERARRSKRNMRLKY